MTYQQYDSSTKHARLMRAEAGDFLKRSRMDAGLTQRELAERLDLKYYTFISQVENGQGRLPPKLWVKTAKALGKDVRDFALSMLSYYDPHAWMAITQQEELKEGTNGY